MHALARLTAAVALLAIAAPGQSAQAEEPIQVVVSLDEQRLEVYRGAETIAQAPVSTGKAGHVTPTGIFSILEKRKFHRSNIYSNAPMPFMQRLTWTGIALHEGKLPGYPASHGCVRLPNGFAEKLFSMTPRGAHVIISGRMHRPEPISHSALPQPGEPEQEPTRDHWVLAHEHGLRLGGELPQFVSTAAMMRSVADERPQQPLRILVTRRDRRETTLELQSLLTKLGYDPGPADGLLGKATIAAIREFQEDRRLPVTGALTADVRTAIWKAAGKRPPSSGRIYVRQAFKPVFDAPIEFIDPEKPLGAHLFVATGFDRDAMRTGWLVTSLTNRISSYEATIFDIDGKAPQDVPAAEALSRIVIPDDIMRRISGMLTPGSSIAVSDTGLGPYTGWNTDFVVKTRL